MAFEYTNDRLKLNINCDSSFINYPVDINIPEGEAYTETIDNYTENMSLLFSTTETDPMTLLFGPRPSNLFAPTIPPDSKSSSNSSSSDSAQEQPKVNIPKARQVSCAFTYNTTKIQTNSKNPNWPNSTTSDNVIQDGLKKVLPIPYSDKPVPGAPRTTQHTLLDISQWQQNKDVTVLIPMIIDDKGVSNFNTFIYPVIFGQKGIQTPKFNPAIQVPDEVVLTIKPRKLRRFSGNLYAYIKNPMVHIKCLRYCDQKECLISLPLNPKNIDGTIYNYIFFDLGNFSGNFIISYNINTIYIPSIVTDNQTSRVKYVIQDGQTTISSQLFALMEKTIQDIIDDHVDIELDSKKFARSSNRRQRDVIDVLNNEYIHDFVIKLVRSNDIRNTEHDPSELIKAITENNDCGADFFKEKPVNPRNYSICIQSITCDGDNTDEDPDNNQFRLIHSMPGEDSNNLWTTTFGFTQSQASQAGLLKNKNIVYTNKKTP